jgi:hypothetical protein
MLTRRAPPVWEADPELAAEAAAERAASRPNGHDREAGSGA